VAHSLALGQSNRLSADSGLGTLYDALAALAAREPGSGRSAGEVLTAVRHIPAREAQWAAMPEWVRPELAAAYAAKGIRQLYSHQAEAAARVRAGRNIVIVTPTASGKTVCYNLPVVNAVLENPDTRALYLFPTKALAQDQLAELHDLAGRLDDRFGVFTYDGDTPSDARKAIRERGQIVITNPDMLHTGILPHHTRWMRLFENLRYVVLDELHTCRGVFGSHVANVLRRMARIARFYGSQPQFICSSATIANPGELAARVAGAPFEVLAESGAPAGEKFIVFYNPPVVNRPLGIRRSYINEAWRVAQEFLSRGLQVIVFANSRLQTEVLLTYLRRANSAAPGAAETVRGYRGGYLPGERREIERGLREGRIRGVVSTNALELGMDIGSLDVAVLAGYPGTIASTWQRAGRAGRRNGSSCAVLVASSAPLDQFIANHPDYFFGRSPEHAFIQPDNLEILVNHLKCAAFELPLAPGERFGTLEVDELARQLEAAGFLHRAGQHWHWTEESYPADAISLRSATSDNFVILDVTGEETKGRPEVIGEVDFTSALTTIHPKAIYLHEGEQYQVERLDFDERKAYVKRVAVDYFTDAIRYTQVRILEKSEEAEIPAGGRAARPTANAAAASRGESAKAWNAARAHGDVLVRSQVVGFKKIKFFTNENVGSGQLELPENEMHTTAFWITLRRELVEALPFSVSERQAGMFGLLYALKGMATLLLMCDQRDLGTAIGERPPDVRGGAPAEACETEAGAAEPVESSAGETREFFEPNLYLYDAYAGGIGLSEPLFAMYDELIARARALIEACPCAAGCPSCVGPTRTEGLRPAAGPAGDIAEHAKEAALALLGALAPGQEAET
jgi:DEAD/DEAH box helicase domain-containing protein